jgi:hypothetical protein
VEGHVDRVRRTLGRSHEYGKPHGGMQQDWHLALTLFHCPASARRRSKVAGTELGHIVDAAGAAADRGYGGERRRDGSAAVHVHQY